MRSMVARTNYHPVPVFDPAIPARHQQVLSGAPDRLLPPCSARPRKRTRWRAKPVDTVAMLIAFLIISLIIWIFMAGLSAMAFGSTIGTALAFLFTPLAIGIPVWYVGRLAGERLNDKALRVHHGKYLRPEEFDTQSGYLLGRAQNAVRTVLRSEVHRQGLIDAQGNTVLLPHYLWELARLLHDQSGLRAEQQAASAGVMTEELRAVLLPQREALRRSTATVTARVERLEEYAHRVQVAESAYRARALMSSNDKYRDLLARTDDQDALAHLTTGVDEVESTLRASLQAAIAAGETLAS